MRRLTTLTLSFLLLIGPLVGPSLACTSFCFETPDGPFFAANLDLFIPADGLVLINRRGIVKENSRQGTTGKTAKWISKYGSVTFNIAGRGFVWSGMNEAGLVISGMELKASEYPEPDERPPFDLGSWTQYVLDTCGSVQEAIQVDSRIRLVRDGSEPSHFLITDAKGNTAAIEYLDGQFVVYTGENLPVKAMSNMPYALALDAFKRGGHPWWKWSSDPGQSAERFAGTAVRMQNFDPDGGISAIAYSFTTLSKVVAAAHTKWSVVYDIAKRVVWFGSVVSPKGKHLSLNAFDLSCGAPLLMLKVNTAFEGNVEGAFTPYDQEVNLKVFSTYCALAGIQVTQKDAIDLMRRYESFKCAR